MFHNARGAALIGAPTGAASGFMVIDIDIPTEWKRTPELVVLAKDRDPDCPGWTWYRENRHRLGSPLKVRTRMKGLHLIYKYASGVHNSTGNTKGIAPGVDVRAEGGYVVLWDPNVFKGTHKGFPEPPHWLVEDAIRHPYRAKKATNAKGGGNKSSQQEPPRKPRPFRSRVDVLKSLARLYRGVLETPEGGRSQAIYDAVLPMSSLIGEFLTASELHFIMLKAAIEAGHPYERSLSTVNSAFQANGVPTPVDVYPSANDDWPEHLEAFWQDLKRHIGHMGLALSKYPNSNRAEPTVSNLMTILTEVASVRGLFAYDEFTKLVMVTRPVPHSAFKETYPTQYQDHHTTCFRLYLEREFNLVASAKAAEEAINSVSRINAYDSLKEYFNTLHGKWDGKVRIERYFVDGFGAEDNTLNRAYGRCFFIACVRRALVPGTKVDYTPIVWGKQGIRKSMALLATCPNPKWYLENLTSMTNKDGLQQLAGKLIIELAELVAFRRSDIDSRKNFMTRQTDNYRAPYDKAPADHPRRGVFVGTTNDQEHASNDPTGNRRLWSIHVTKGNVDWVTKNIEQLWAEAYVAAQTDEQHWLTEELEKESAEVETENRPEDPWLPTFIRFAKGKKKIRTEAFFASIGLPTKDLNQSHRTRANAMARSLGYKKAKSQRKGDDASRFWVPAEGLSIQLSKQEPTPPDDVRPM
jgi:predicted P-loop ATPase